MQIELRADRQQHSAKARRSYLMFGNATLFPLYSLLLCLVILNLNADVGFAQEPPSAGKHTGRNIARLDKQRRLAYHTHFLQRLANSSPMIEVVWNMEDVLSSLRFLAENGSEKDNDVAKVAGSIFRRTEDVAARELCLSALKKINNKVAQKEMWRIYHDVTVPAEWRNACAEYLRIAPQPEKPNAGRTEVSAGPVTGAPEKPLKP